MTALQKTSALAMAGLCVIVTGCNKSTMIAEQPGQTSTLAGGQPAYTSGTPADGNLAPVQNANYEVPPNSQGDYYPDYDTQEAPVYAPQPPPELPEYSQPECPGEDEIWTPGYWNYASGGYYWVPGVWVMAPYVGALWTPPYWVFETGRYRLHHGFWAPHVGYYGGINYGFGYLGRGYYGGYWRDNNFYYNRSVTNVNVNIVRNVYDYRVSNTNVRTAYAGGNGGVRMRPTPAELAVMHEQIRPPLSAQIQHRDAAARDRALFAAVNHGRPAALVSARPLDVGYRAPSPRPARFEARGMQPNREPNRPEPNYARPGAAQQPRPTAEGRQAFEGRPAAQTQPAQQFRPGAHGRDLEQRLVPQPAVKRAAPESRIEQRIDQRPTPEPKAGGRPAAIPTRPPEARPAPAAAPPHMESRPAPEPRMQPRPATTPAAAPRPEPRAEPAPHNEPHPGPAPHSGGHPEPDRKPPEHH